MRGSRAGDALRFPSRARIRFESGAAMGSEQRARWSLVLAGAVMLAGCGPKQVILRASVTDLAREQQVTQSCPAGADACKPGNVVNEGDFNQSRTAFLPLPTCPHGIGRILIKKVHGQLEATATCLDAENGGQPQCPPGTELIPDVENGGMKCGEEEPHG